MSKELKLYIPVTCVKPVQRMKNHRPVTVNEARTTLIAVNNCPVIKAELPPVKDIIEHIIQQRQTVVAGGHYTVIKMSVTPTLFGKFCKEISCKMGARYISPIIDVIMALGQLPVMQIQGNKAEPAPITHHLVRPGVHHMVRTK